jgi:hypothetical protein
MTGRVHILRTATPSHYRLVFVPGGPDRHLVEGAGALRDFLLTELAIPPGVTETAMTELGTRGRYTIEDILVTDTIKTFWRRDAPPPPPEPKPPSPEPSKPAKRTPRRAIARRTRAEPKPTRKAKRTGRTGR